MTFILEEENALQQYLLGMTVGDENSPTRPVDVGWTLKDIEGNDRKFPFIILDMVDIVPALYRKHNGLYSEKGTTVGETTPTGVRKFVRKMPEPYDLIYQITSRSRHPRHDRMIINSMFQKFPSNWGIIPILPTATVPDQEGNCRPAFLSEFIKADIIDDAGKKMFRNIWTITIPSELDPVVASAAKTVTSVRINVPPIQFIPAGMDIV